MAKLLPVLLIVLGLAGGLGAGYVLRPVPDVVEDDPDAPPVAPPPPFATALYDLSGQFLVPLVVDGRVTAIVIVELALEIDASAEEIVARTEPLLRDRLLRVLFDHANIGGFEGMFTSASNMDMLRRNLQESAAKVFDKPIVTEVLITNLLRNGA